MNFKTTLGALLLVTLLLPYRVLAAQSWPELPMPPKAQVQWIAQNMRVNGAPTRVLQFQSRASREEVVDYYRAHWSGGYDHDVSVHTLGNATIVGQKHGPYLMTVKVEPGAGGQSHGLISIAQVLGVPFDRSARPLALLPGAHVVSVVESDDPGKHSRQVVIMAPQPLSSVTQFYEASLTSAGWHQMHDNASPSTRGPSNGRFVVFAQGGSEMQLSIVEPRRGGGSTVLANLVTKDTVQLTR